MKINNKNSAQNSVFSFYFFASSLLFLKWHAIFLSILSFTSLNRPFGSLFSILSCGCRSKTLCLSINQCHSTSQERKRHEIRILRLLLRYSGHRPCSSYQQNTQSHQRHHFQCAVSTSVVNKSALLDNYQSRNFPLKVGHRVKRTTMCASWHSILWRSATRSCSSSEPFPVNVIRIYGLLEYTMNVWVPSSRFFCLFAPIFHHCHHVR